MGAEDAMKEIFYTVIKMVIPLTGVAIFYIWLEAKFLRKMKNKGKERK